MHGAVFRKNIFRLGSLKAVNIWSRYVRNLIFVLGHLSRMLDLFDCFLLPLKDSFLFYLLLHTALHLVLTTETQSDVSLDIFNRKLPVGHVIHRLVFIFVLLIIVIIFYENAVIFFRGFIVFGCYIIAK